VTSEEYEEIVRRGYELFNETGELDLDMVGPDIEYRNLMPDTGVIRGREAVRSATRRWFEAFDSYRQTIEEIDVQGDHVIVSVRQTGRIKGSADEVSHVVAHAWRFREGRATHWTTYRTKEEALEAEGLSE
jgi:ketosteroid isomerase-like protein